MSTRFEVLHALRVKGLARPAVLAGLTGIAEDDLPAATKPLIDEGLVLAREGTMAGYMLTAAGKSAAEQELASDDLTQSSVGALEAFDQDFLPINTDFKKICHRWQVKGDETPNDHCDTDYDKAVIADLAQLHQRFTPILGGVAEALPRFGRYLPRLQVALERIEGGDTGAFARPMADSYHDIWMELHNDVVLSLGRQRNAADESTH